MYSSEGDSVPEAASWIELGRFKVNTSGVWQRNGFRAPLNGVSARFAIRYTVANGGPTGTNYIGIDALTIERTDLSLLPTTINITLAIEALINPSSNMLLLKDTVTAYLRDTLSPYTLRASSRAVIDSVSLNGSFIFNGLDSVRRYYIVVRYKNGIETWSRGGGELIIPGQTFSYDFTTSISKAFGNNLVLRGTKYCIFSGDINQDGFIDASDVSIIENDVYNFVTGYVNSDLNGDGFVDGSDYAFVDNNAFNFISEVTLRPPGYFITYNNGIVNIPNSTIMYNGQLFVGSISIPENKMIGIVKDTTAYLYFTGMGDVDLSEESSDKAFIKSLFTDRDSSNFDNVELSTGIKIEETGNQYKFTNLKKRFAIVKNQNVIKYLHQRSNLINLGILDVLGGGIYQINYDNITIPVTSLVSTYGATMRLIPVPILWPYLISVNNEAIMNGADPTLLGTLNLIDFFYFVLFDLNDYTNFIDIPCLELILKHMMAVILQGGYSIAVQAITNDPRLSNQIWQDFVNQTFSNYIDAIVDCILFLPPEPATKMLLLIKRIFQAVITFINLTSNGTILDFLNSSAFATWNPTIQNGLLAYYPFNSNFYDESGNGNNGSPINNPVFSNDRHGVPSHALLLNGTNQFVSVPSLNILDNLAISFWVKTSQSDPDPWPSGMFLIDRDICYAARDWSVTMGLGGKVILNTGMSNRDSVLVSSSSINNGNWNHVVIIRDASNMQNKIYINGNLNASCSFDNLQFGNNVSNIYFGASVCNTYSHDFCNGILDDIRIYNRALNDSEIQTLFLE
ncbi:MAG: hypothetical protein HGGPFJEG_00452 [Ignavibacteria bacterium]|nr:hypothetical protein [Ignavibacteria bacterium]